MAVCGLGLVAGGLGVSSSDSSEFKACLSKILFTFPFYFLFGTGNPRREWRRRRQC